MVDVKEAFVLCEKHSGRVCVGVEAGRSDAEVICSFEDGHIGIYDIERRHCINQWQLSCGDNLTSAAIFHRSTAQYHAVKNNSELISWSHDTETSNHFSITPLKLPVHSLLATPTLCVIVYVNGTMEPVHGAHGGKRKSRKQKSATGQYKSVSKALYYEEDASGYLLLLSCGDGTYFITVYLCTDDGGCSERDTVDVQVEGEIIDFRLSGNILLLSCSFGVIFKADPSLLISTSTLSLSKLLQLSLPAVTTAIIGKGYLAVVQRTLATPGSPLPSTNVPAPSTNVPVPSTNVPIPSTNASSSVTISKAHWMLRIFDIKYGTMSAATTVNTASDVKLLYHQGHIVLSNAENVLVYPVSIRSQSSLATVLGRRQRFQPVTSVQWLEKEGASPCVDQITEFISKLDADQISSDTVATCCQVLHEPANLSQPNIIARVERMAECLLESDGKWCHNELKVLITKGIFPFRQMTSLINKALSQSDWVLLAVLLRHCRSIPEHCIVQLLSEVLQLPESFNVKQVMMTKADLICGILQLPGDSSRIQQSLLSLKQESIVLLVEALTNMVDYTNLISIHASTLSYSSLLDWVGLVLDTHFIRLVRDTQARPLLVELRDKVLSQAVFLSRLSVIVNSLSRPGSLEQTNKLHRNNWLYKVERLELDI